MRSTAARGFSLAEVVVATTLIAVLGVILVRIYDVSLHAYRYGTQRVELERRARQALRSIESYLSAAVMPSETQEAVYSPDEGETSRAIEFATTVEPFDPRDPQYWKRRIAFEPSEEAAGEVWLDYGTASEKRLAANIEDLTFRLYGQSQVEVAILVYHTDTRPPGQQWRRPERRIVERWKADPERYSRPWQEYQLKSVFRLPFYSTR